MRKLKFLGQAGLLAIALYLLIPAPMAYAYIDPGTGSFILQGIVAALLGAVVAIKAYWRRLTSFFGRLTGRRPEAPAEEENG